MSESKQVPIAPQAALNEYAALNEFQRNRNLLLAQQVHELSATVDVLCAELAETRAALEAELNKDGA
ncbi:hypothetical protein [Phyllobacterium lublinensis]|uniref:hypothetical protein n=1 Tax=Phyllobacterium lublinensis TaxID=2875708 RepID=UPI001CC97436|nr:hypothetical protein [Phyllobacterium sp. 2063]MBZ9653560.1 hypothetical protein [Phyllobacterium sp. 2063]